MLPSVVIDGVRINARGCGPAKRTCATVASGPYIIAEISGNHGQKFEHALALIDAAKEAGVHAVKLQTYTPDTLTLNVRTPHFALNSDTLWGGQYYHDLYAKGCTPWEWQPKLFAYARKIGLTCFSTPFDESAVDFLEREVQPPAYKIASFELNHLPLLKHVARTRKPVILSTGLATEAEIGEAVDVLRVHGTEQIILLKCVTNYPAQPETFNLRTLKTLRQKFRCWVGLSDHSLGDEIAVAATALGACVIEKHLMLDNTEGAVDAGFSLTPERFKKMVNAVRCVHAALGDGKIGPTEQEQKELHSRRSIFVSKNIQQGERFSYLNLKIVRPGDGLHPRYWEQVLGRCATQDLRMGEPLQPTHFK